MLEITYFIKQNEKDPLLDIFRSLVTSQSRNNHKAFFKDKTLNITQIQTAADISAIKNGGVQAILKKNGVKSLPIVTVNQKIRKIGQLLEIRELEDLIDGLSIQVDEETRNRLQP
ncbi:MAG: arsenic metallochaperone ArsD family protein [Lentilactobacillus hilgardii]|uniref:arsenic metallochaperone ArsD family protein n=1 Tax=Lentilactobacillus hilgardii TaxID=1588 RepID=UPI001CC217D6|nr:arsenic metallochaperone ArsD family protein [Lentilactobacillus hilgardii]MBZ2201582.1 hypothetical protein [Lentilactobacillus hilgardii]MBZ2204500.1 hypothetical protein [Lentilactobacillus hilgardii]